MALAPTLVTFKNVAVGVGLATLAGLSVTNETGQRQPTAGLAATSGNVPTISVQLGPTTDADVGYLSLEGLVPFMWGSRTITTFLPDGIPEQNDLTPTLVWGDFVAPTRGLITTTGLAPAVVGDTGQRIAIPVGSAVIAGLAPTVSGPAGQSGLAEPDKAEVAFILGGAAPTLFLEISAPLADHQSEGVVLTMTGLVPTLYFNVGWSDVPAAEDPVWVDVPRV
jgi:hypothetical protein